MIDQKEYKKDVRPTERWFVNQRRAEFHERKLRSRRKKTLQPWMVSAMAEHAARIQ